MSTQIRRLDDHRSRGHDTSRLRAERRQRQGGFSLTELTVLLAVVGVLATFSTPYFLSFYRTAQVRGAASDIAAYLNQGRQLALQRNGNVCVHITASAMHYHLAAVGEQRGLGRAPTPWGIFRRRTTSRSRPRPIRSSTTWARRLRQRPTPCHEERTR